MARFPGILGIPVLLVKVLWSHWYRHHPFERSSIVAPADLPSRWCHDYHVVWYPLPCDAHLDLCLVQLLCAFHHVSVLCRHFCWFPSSRQALPDFDPDHSIPGRHVFGYQLSLCSLLSGHARSTLRRLGQCRLPLAVDLSLCWFCTSNLRQAISQQAKDQLRKKKRHCIPIFSNPFAPKSKPTLYYKQRRDQHRKSSFFPVHLMSSSSFAFSIFFFFLIHYVMIINSKHISIDNKFAIGYGYWFKSWQRNWHRAWQSKQRPGASLLSWYQRK